VSACAIEELVLSSTVGIVQAHIKVIEGNSTPSLCRNMDKISLPRRRLCINTDPHTQQKQKMNPYMML